MSVKPNKKDIAVIGLSGKYPRCSSIAAFWEKISSGESLSHFYSDAELSASGISEQELNDPDYVKADAFLEDAGDFDYAFFGYTRKEAALMDPQIRLMHQQVWLALEDAGCNPLGYGGRIGLFTAASENMDWKINALLTANPDVNSFFLRQISEPRFISTLISYKLNLKGPSYFMDTACSSSLSAVHVAARSLLMNECAVAVAGGVSLTTRSSKGYRYRPGMIGSRDGYCRTFDAAASGTIGGEGVGVVVMKRLEDALRDGDRVYAVIKASATNNDGNRKVGYTAPSIAGQAECIRLAHRAAGIDPATVSYVEAHGTATLLGDPVEIEALNLAFNNHTGKHCAIGSVKSNMGHLDAAAGIAGFIKTVLALKHRQLPPSLHFNTPNPAIRFDDGPFYVNTQLTPWESKNGEPLRAGVSSFGIGGTNAHVLLEEAPQPEAAGATRPYQLILLSAKSESALAAGREQLKTFLRDPALCLPDLAYTLQTGRAPFGHRGFLVCRSAEEGLSALSGAGFQEGHAPGTDAKKQVVFMFPGQGSQYTGMGKNLYDGEPFFRNIIDQGLTLLRGYAGEDFSAVLLGGQPDPAINHTRCAQPLLFLFEYGLAQLLMHWGIMPDHMIGHSIGEYVAACLSGVFSFEDGLWLVYQRGSLMARAAEGAMLSVAQPADAIRPLLPEGVSVAAVNSPDACVVSGPFALIANLEAQLTARELPHGRLKTSHAFHSGMMEPVLDDFARAAGAIKMNPPQRPFLSNLTGRPITPTQAVSPGYWVQHLRGTVLFGEGLESLAHQTDRVVVEVGPGRTLSTLYKQNKSLVNGTRVVVNLVRHPGEVHDDQAGMARALGLLWLHGVGADWAAYYAAEKPHKAAAPAYCFDKVPFDHKVDIYARFKQLAGTGGLIRRELPEWFYAPKWKRATAPREPAGRLSENCFLLFTDQSTWARALREKMIDGGNRVVEVTQGDWFATNEGGVTIDPWSGHDYDRLHQYLAGQGFAVNQIVYAWGTLAAPAAGAGPVLPEAVKTLNADFYHTLAILQSLGVQTSEAPVRFSFFTRLHADVYGNENRKPAAAAALALLRVAAQENPAATVRTIDLDAPEADEDLVEKLYAELFAGGPEQEVAYRNNNRWVKFYDPVVPQPTTAAGRLQPRATYLVTGGLGQVAFMLARHLLKKYAANVVLTGRTILPAPAQWDDYLRSGSRQQRVVEKIEKLKELGALPGFVTYCAADVADYDGLLRVVQTIEATYGAVSGVIHAAGELGPGAFKAVDALGEDAINAQFRPKINGVLNLYAIFGDQKPGFVWITSSLASVLGGLTFGAYAAANSFMDCFAAMRRGHWYAVNLDGVSGGNEAPIGEAELVEIFEMSLGLPEAGQWVVSPRPLELGHWSAPANATPGAGGQSGTGPGTAPGRYAAAGTGVESALVALWEDFFGISGIGPDDEFFELGGDSLKAMQLSRRIQKIFGLEIPIDAFFKYPTISSLAAEIDVGLRLMDIEKNKTARPALNEIII